LKNQSISTADERKGKQIELIAICVHLCWSAPICG